MCNHKEKRCIHNINRTVIAAASGVAMLIDGVNTANCIYFVSAILWLFLPECDAAEEMVFECIRESGVRVVGKKLLAVVRTCTGKDYTELCVQKCEASAQVDSGIKG